MRRPDRRGGAGRFAGNSRRIEEEPFGLREPHTCQGRHPARQKETRVRGDLPKIRPSQHDCDRRDCRGTANDPIMRGGNHVAFMNSFALRVLDTDQITRVGTIFGSLRVNNLKHWSGMFARRSPSWTRSRRTRHGVQCRRRLLSERPHHYPRRPSLRRTPHLYRRAGRQQTGSRKRIDPDRAASTCKAHEDGPEIPRASFGAGRVAGGHLRCRACATGHAADLRKSDRVIVLKGERCLGRNPVGPKTFELDGSTPEGEYVIDRRTRKAPYRVALHISYPGRENPARAARYKLPAGGGIYVHGTPGGGSRFERDWTDGCIAVSNQAIDEISALVDDGTPIEVRAQREPAAAEPREH